MPLPLIDLITDCECVARLLWKAQHTGADGLFAVDDPVEQPYQTVRCVHTCISMFHSAAEKHAKVPCVTVSVDDISFNTSVR